MKKALAVLLCFAYAVSLAACTNPPRFENESAMMEHLHGMWVEDDTLNDKTYYVFQDEKIYIFNDVQFSNNIDAYFDSFVSDGKLDALRKLDYAATIDEMDIQTIIGNPEENTTIQPNKGKIIFDEGKTYEKSIIVTEETVSVKEADKSTLLIKLSDVVDFSGAHFEGIFKKTKEDYTIPISKLAYNADTYGNALKAIHPEIKDWILTDKSDRTIVYTENGSANNSGGTYMITESMLTLSKGTSTKNGAPFVLMYDLNGVLGQNYHLFICDQLGSSVKTLLDNAAPLLEGLPGALSTKEILSLYEQQHRVSSGARLFETTVNSFTYKINQATTGNNTVIYITFPETVSLSSITSYANTMPEESESSATQPTESQDDHIEETVPVQTVPMHEVPYTTALSGSVGIYKSHDLSSAFVQTIGQDGIFTITEEAYDDEGNLWGKLKSGLGWVLLEEANTASGRTCPQCGLSEPDAIFTEDWQPGDICFGCSYDNFHGGEEAKKFCSQCGADCTYRGLEEDGRCEDCYFSDSNSPNISRNSGGNTSQQPASCSHSYTDATCIKPQTCTKCGAISGAALGHTYSNATCTTPQTCKTCGATAGSAAGHKWKSATCTHPETCSVCNLTQGDALGHNMGLTKCSRCDHTDYSTVAKSYSKVTSYDSKTGEDLEVINVSVSSAGILSFTFNGNTYSIKIKERVYDSMTCFDCYQNGSKLSNAECRIGNASYYNMLHFEWDGVDGHRLYFYTEKQ